MSRLSFKEIRKNKVIAKAIITPMLTAKRDKTVASAYERIAPADDSRVRTVLSPVGTSTFRLASSDSPLFRDGSTNLQNLAKKVARIDTLYQVRDCIIADEGYVLVAADYSGAEAVGVGAYSGDWSYVDRLLNGEDTHTTLATAFYGSTSTETERKVQRDIAKMIRYASSYFAQVRTITQRLNKDADITGIYFTESEVLRLHKILLQLHPLERWWAEMREYLDKHNGVVRNCFDYRRTFYDTNPDYRLKDALSFLPQSTVAWLINEAMVAFYPHDCPDIQLLLQIHDELLFQCREPEIPYLVNLMTPVLERRFKVHGHELYIPVEWKSGLSWGSMKKFEHKLLLAAA